MIVLCLRHYIKCFQSPDIILPCTENASGDGLLIWAFLQSLLPPQISTLSPVSLPPCEKNWKLDFVHGPLGCTEVQRAKEEGGNPVRKAAFRCDHCTARFFFLIQFKLISNGKPFIWKLSKNGLSRLLKLTVYPFIWSPLILFQWKRIWNSE